MPTIDPEAFKKAADEAGLASKADIQRVEQSIAELKARPMTAIEPRQKTPETPATPNTTEPTWEAWSAHAEFVNRLKVQTLMGLQQRLSPMVAAAVQYELDAYEAALNGTEE